MYSLVEVEGPLTTASNKRGVSIDCKINLLDEELHWLEMSITYVSKINGLDRDFMKWMGLLWFTWVNQCMEDMTWPSGMKELESLYKP